MNQPRGISGGSLWKIQPLTWYTIRQEQGQRHNNKRKNTTSSYRLGWLKENANYQNTLKSPLASFWSELFFTSRALNRPISILWGERQSYSRACVTWQVSWLILNHAPVSCPLGWLVIPLLQRPDKNWMSDGLLSLRVRSLSWERVSLLFVTLHR